MGRYDLVVRQFSQFTKNCQFIPKSSMVLVLSVSEEMHMNRQHKEIFISVLIDI